MTQYQGIINTVKEYPTCNFYVNGDNFSPPSKVCISSRVKTFESLKDEVTSSLSKYSSCTSSVCRIYTPVGGTEITDLEQFQDGASYVAASVTHAAFKRLPYTDIPDRLRAAKRGQKKIKTYTPVEHASEEKYRKLNSRLSSEFSRFTGLRLRVHETTRGNKAACPVSVSYRDQHDLTRIMIEIEKSMVLPRPIDEMYKLGNQGGPNDTYTLVTTPSDLENDDHVVVVPWNCSLERKQYYPYDGKPDFINDTSPHSVQYYLHTAFPPLKPTDRWKGTSGRMSQDGEDGRRSSRTSLASRAAQNQGLRLRVQENGNWSEPVTPVIIQPRDRTQMPRIKKMIKETLNLPPIKQMYRVGAEGNFIRVSDPKDLNRDAHVVVVTRRDSKPLKRDVHYTPEGIRDLRVSTAPRDMPPHLYEPFPSPPPLTCRHKVDLSTYRDYE